MELGRKIDMAEERYTHRQIDQYHAYIEISDQYGPWNKGPGNEGSHYSDGADNPFIEEGITCVNCVFFTEPDGCMIVSGLIDPEGVCKLWIIPEERLEF